MLSGKPKYDCSRLGLPTIKYDETNKVLFIDHLNAHDLKHYDEYVNVSLKSLEIK